MNLQIRTEFPRLPLDGKIDLTYRCNNNCRHCWLWVAPDAKEKQLELSFSEIRQIVDEARAMGCQAWSISGGEPMLRPDFPDVFDFITSKTVQYSINTNGTLITPEIARLLKRRGKKMIALYGATADVHDRVTRNPGSFEAAMRGFAYLKEAGTDFIVQIIPMRENYHQYAQMLSLANSLSPVSRVGAPWLWLSACQSTSRNTEISRQRLDPAEVIKLDEPDPIPQVQSQMIGDQEGQDCIKSSEKKDDRLFVTCIKNRRDFHIDSYGKMSFCYYVKDPALRYDLRIGTFREAWDEFIPSLADVIRGGAEYLENCESCEYSRDCRWCGVYGYLEHGRYGAKVEYLCQVARENLKFKEDWRKTHLRYFQIAGITMQVTADFPMRENTFAPIFEKFHVTEPGSDIISIHHSSPIPSLSKIRFGDEVLHSLPWAIFQHNGTWIYKGITSDENSDNPFMIGFFNQDHNQGRIYRKTEDYLHGNLASLTTFVSDQLLLARVLADRQGCYLHAAGIILNGQGFLFVGHSEAGKSTMLKLLRGHGEILCDDRIIIRRWPEGFKIHGTWSHGELPDVSPKSAPLKAIMYLEKAATNELIEITEKQQRLGKVLSHVVKPLITADWWEKTLDLAGKVATEIPAYRLMFDKSGKIVDVLKQLD